MGERPADGPDPAGRFVDLLRPGGALVEEVKDSGGVACVRCGKHTRSPRRKLCSGCYQSMRVSGHLHDWPRMNALPEPDLPLYCMCDTPKPVSLAPFPGHQCGICWRGID